MSSEVSNANYGCLFGVGVGPGDPELVTLKAKRVLQSVPIICVPQSDTSRESYALSIVQGFIDLEKQEILRFGLPNRRRRSRVQRLAVGGGNFSRPVASGSRRCFYHRRRPNAFQHLLLCVGKYPHQLSGDNGRDYSRRFFGDGRRRPAPVCPWLPTVSGWLFCPRCMA